MNFVFMFIIVCSTKLTLLVIKRLSGLREVKSNGKWINEVLLYTIIIVDQ